MSDEKDQKDLKDEELDSVSGGYGRANPMGHEHHGPGPGEGFPEGERGEPDGFKQGGPIHPGL